MDEHDERVYAKAAENFQLFQDKGWLVQDNKENYYIYAQTMNGENAIRIGGRCLCSRLYEWYYQKA